MSINEATNIDESFTASISGSYPVGVGSIEGHLGIEIGEEETYGTKYEIETIEDEVKTIVFRAKINRYELEQTKYKLNTYTGKKTIVDTKTAYVDAFVDWHYSWVYGYSL